MLISLTHFFERTLCACTKTSVLNVFEFFYVGEDSYCNLLCNFSCLGLDILYVEAGHIHGESHHRHL
jgi:hypothetical protein